MDILRHKMKDKSEGELYHAWMCNIKFAVYDHIVTYRDTMNEQDLLLSCEEGAEMFLDRLLQEES